VIHVFPELSDYRFEGDEAGFHAVNGYSSDWLAALWVTLSSRAFLVPVLVLLAAAIVVQRKRTSPQLLLQFGLAFLVVDGVGAQLLKPLFHRLRPNMVLAPDTFSLLAPASAASMPSLHAANAVLVAVLFSTVFVKLRWFLRILALLISISRLGVGVHWPSDIVMGALWGGLIGILTTAQIRKAAQRS
jgi:undecaprenyl-diphosphatase